MFFKKKQDLISTGSNDINSRVELTLLDARATEKDVVSFCNIAYKNRYLGVVVFPCNVKIAKEYIGKKLDGALKVIAAVDFPFGGATASTKIAEAKRCFQDGADEVDVTINTGEILEERFNEIKSTISRIVRSSRGKVVKAVIETSYLNRENLSKVIRCLLKTKVDFVMTNTGFGEGGATPEVVEIINAICKNKCMVKASGGITNKAIAGDMIRMGAQRIGTSRVI